MGSVGGKVVGVAVEQVFLDRVCGQTLIQKYFVPKRGIAEEMAKLKRVHGDISKYPVA